MVRVVTFSCDGNYMISASDDGHVCIWAIRGAGLVPDDPESEVPTENVNGQTA